jgi:hypothetical protein
MATPRSRIARRPRSKPPPKEREPTNFDAEGGWSNPKAGSEFDSKEPFKPGQKPASEKRQRNTRKSKP